MVVLSKEIEVKQSESNTLSDLSTLPSQHNNDTAVGATQEALFGGTRSWCTLDNNNYTENESNIGQIERYVKN